MADVFISYSSEDRERAGKVAQALEAAGWSVWWDRKIIAGQAFDETIESALNEARCVVVLWSRHSIASEWVKNEAAVGAKRGVLVPAFIESVQLPLEFRRKQTADLTGWNGETSHPGFQSVCAGIANVLGNSPRILPRTSPEQTPRANRRWIFLLVALLAVVAAGVGLVHWHSGASPDPDTTSSDLANLVAGKYRGDVISDSKGTARSDVVVTVTKVSPTHVRIDSDYVRIGNLDVDLTKVGTDILNADGDSVFHIYSDRNPPLLELSPHNELSYSGKKVP